jgi:hypothetical protein
MNGSLRLERPAFTHEGTRTACRNGTASFAARLQR